MRRIWAMHSAGEVHRAAAASARGGSGHDLRQCGQEPTQGEYATQ